MNILNYFCEDRVALKVGIYAMGLERAFEIAKCLK